MQPIKNRLKTNRHFSELTFLTILIVPIELTSQINENK